jgi:hypothetical protein
VGNVHVGRIQPVEMRSIGDADRLAVLRVLLAAEAAASQPILVGLSINDVINHTSKNRAAMYYGNNSNPPLAHT